MNLLSVIVPCYNEEATLRPFTAALEELRPQLPELELLLINDGSGDGTEALMRALAAEHPWIHYYSFSRNFGKESAILAGLAQARGDYAVVMDADLQDPPALLPEMVRLVTEEGYDCVGTRRVNRKGEPPIRSFFARLFYRLINHMSDIQLVDGARDYKLLCRGAVNALLAMPEYNRFSKGLYEWVGFRTKWLEFENVERVAGETKWSFWKLFKYSLEGICAFSTTPLIWSALMGMLMMLAALGGIVALIIREYLYHVSAYGWTSMVCLVLLIGGMQLFCMGIMGQYLAKTYLETKRRPHYIIARSSEETLAKRGSEC